MSNTFSNDDKLLLIKRINNIKLKKHKKKYYIQLFNIINKNNTKYTKNLNGIFFNLSCLNNNQAEELYKLIKDYIKNLDTYDKEINDIKKLVLNDVVKKKKEIKYLELDINTFTDMEKKIINISKKY